MKPRKLTREDPDGLRLAIEAGDLFGPSLLVAAHNGHRYALGALSEDRCALDTDPQAVPWGLPAEGMTAPTTAQLLARVAECVKIAGEDRPAPPGALL